MEALNVTIIIHGNSAFLFFFLLASAAHKYTEE